MGLIGAEDLLEQKTPFEEHCMDLPHGYNDFVNGFDDHILCFGGLVQSQLWGKYWVSP